MVLDLRIRKVGFGGGGGRESPHTYTQNSFLKHILKIMIKKLRNVFRFVSVKNYVHTYLPNRKCASFCQFQNLGRAFAPCHLVIVP